MLSVVGAHRQVLTLRVTYDAPPKGNLAARTVCQAGRHVLQVSPVYPLNADTLQRVVAARGIAQAAHLAIARAQAVVGHRAIPSRFRQTVALKAGLGDIPGICALAIWFFRILRVNSGGIAWNST